LAADVEKHHLEANTDCSRMIIYRYQHPAGFGSQLSHAILTFAAGLSQNRAAVLAPRWLANYRCRADASADEAWTSCFKLATLGPPACEASDAYRRALGSDPEALPAFDPRGGTGGPNIVRVENLQLVRDVVILSQERMQFQGHTYDYHDLDAYALTRIWRLQDHVKSYVDE
jgi:hypothetical protein